MYELRRTPNLSREDRKLVSHNRKQNKYDVLMVCDCITSPLPVKCHTSTDDFLPSRPCRQRRCHSHSRCRRCHCQRWSIRRRMTCRWSGPRTATGAAFPKIDALPTCTENTEFPHNNVDESDQTQGGTK